MQASTSVPEIQLTAINKRIFSNEEIPIYSVIRYNNRLYQIISVTDSTANAWRGKYRYEANMLAANSPVPSGVIELALS